MSNRKALGVVAGVVVLIGVTLALLPLSVAGRAVGCGSALNPSVGEAVRAEVDAALEGRSAMGLYVAACEEEVSNRRMVAFPIVGVGALALLFVGLTGPRRPTRWDVPEGKSADESAA